MYRIWQRRIEKMQIFSLQPNGFTFRHTTFTIERSTEPFLMLTRVQERGSDRTSCHDRSLYICIAYKLLAHDERR